MTIDLYYIPGSHPCRSVLLAAKAIGVDLNLKLVDLNKGDLLTPEFLKINPAHTVPTIVDNGFALWESRAIITYLQDTYGKTDSLYPKDPKKRALVDQRLYFDIGTLCHNLSSYYFASVFRGAARDPEIYDNLNKALKLLDTFLENSEFVAGDSLTLADLSLVATVSTLDVFGHDLSPFKNIVSWYSKMKETAPGYEEANGKPLEALKEYIASASKE